MQAIFWSIVGALVYLLLFLSRPKSYDVSLGTVATWIGDHKALSLLLIAATLVLIVIALRVIRERLHRQWDQLGQGAAILRTPRRYLSRVVLFQAVSYGCRIGVNVTFIWDDTIFPVPSEQLNRENRWIDRILDMVRPYFPVERLSRVRPEPPRDGDDAVLDRIGRLNLVWYVIRIHINLASFQGIGCRV